MINDLWYKNAVIYCLSVGTFMDANGDGIGDFQGLVRRLDYLHGLGITAIWLMPFQPSPYRDDGYDISDYYGVNSRHGTLGDFVEFTHGAEQRGIRVIMDLVINHTSNRHPWFQEAPTIPIRNIAIGMFGPKRSRPMPTKAWYSREYRNRLGLTTRPRAHGISTASMISNRILILRTRTSKRKS
jgi:Alpha amylase, catalytic domain